MIFFNYFVVKYKHKDRHIHKQKHKHQHLFPPTAVYTWSLATHECSLYLNYYRWFFFGGGGQVLVCVCGKLAAGIESIVLSVFIQGPSAIQSQAG
jgi:hypothetical protein